MQWKVRKIVRNGALAEKLFKSRQSEEQESSLFWSSKLRTLKTAKLADVSIYFNNGFRKLVKFYLYLSVCVRFFFINECACALKKSGACVRRRGKWSFNSPTSLRLSFSPYTPKSSSFNYLEFEVLLLFNSWIFKKKWKILSQKIFRTKVLFFLRILGLNTVKGVIFLRVENANM